MSRHYRPQPLRVHYVLEGYPPPSETFIVREITALEADGHVVAVEALLPPEPGPRHPQVDDVAAAVRYLPRRPTLRDHRVLVAHLRLALRGPGRWAAQSSYARRANREDTSAWRQFLQAGVVADRARRERADHLHVHFASAACEVAATAAALAGISLSVTAHAEDMYAAQHAPHLVRRLRPADAVVTGSAYNRRHLLQALGSEGPTSYHVSNGVDLPAAAVPRRDGPLLCVARLVPKRGVDTLIDAFAGLGPRARDLRLEIIGGGPPEAALREQAVSRGVADLISWHGPVGASEADAAYRRARLVVLPCRIAADGDRDGLPTELVEAAARGVPVVSTDVVGISELVQPGLTGLLVPPDDPFALAAAIEAMLRSPANAEAMGRAARRLVATMFDPARSAQKLAAIFAAAARDRAVRPPRRLGALSPPTKDRPAPAGPPDRAPQPSGQRS